jgi:hypothetical protein
MLWIMTWQTDYPKSPINTLLCNSALFLRFGGYVINRLHKVWPDRTTEKVEGPGWMYIFLNGKKI